MIYRIAVVAVALFFAGSAVAATPGALPDIPTPYLPSTQVAVDEMLRLAGTGPDDLVVDLGSGDGRVVIAAARDYGARGLGIEIDPKLVAESQANARQARLELPSIERLLELELTQRCQKVSAHARLNGVPSQVWEAKLVGDRLSFDVVDTTDRESEAGFYFDGRVSGDVIEGEVARGVGSERATYRWRAIRSGP